MANGTIFVRVRNPEQLRNAITASPAGSLRGVAAAMGTVSHSFIAALASGRRRRLRLEDAQRLSDVLGWEVADLVEVEGLERLRDLGLV